MSYVKNVTRAIKSVGAALLNLPLTSTRNANGEIFYTMVGSGVSALDIGTTRKLYDAFTKCPPLQSVISRKTQYASNAKMWVLNEKDNDEAQGEYAKQLNRLFKRPNPLQNYKQFKAQANYNKYLFGYAIILVVKPAGFTKITNSTWMWVLPGWMLDIKLNGRYYTAEQLKDVFEYIKFNYNNKVIPLELENIIVLTDFNIQKSTSAVLPESRVQGLQLPVTIPSTGLNSINVLTKRRGGIGILSNGSKDAIGTVPIQPGDKKEVEEKLKANYGLHEDLSEIIVTNATLNWQGMAFDVAQLKIHESIQLATDMIADRFTISSLLLSASKNPTFDNISSLEKQAYQNGTIPEEESDAEQFNYFFKTAENNCRIVADFSHVEALQKSKKDEAIARRDLSVSLEREFKNNVITLNQWLEELDYYTIPNGDKYYYELLKEGWQFGNTTQPVISQSTEQPATT